MLEVQVRLHPVLYGSIALDQSVPSILVLVSFAVAYREDMKWENLICMARRCQINAPFQLSVNDNKLHLKICKEKCDYFSKAWKTPQDTASRYLSQGSTRTGG
jgi:hypothetical protein